MIKPKLPQQSDPNASQMSTEGVTATAAGITLIPADQLPSGLSFVQYQHLNDAQPGTQVFTMIYREAPQMWSKTKSVLILTTSIEQAREIAKKMEQEFGFYLIVVV